MILRILSCLAQFRAWCHFVSDTAEDTVEETAEDTAEERSSKATALFHNPISTQQLNSTGKFGAHH